MRSVALDGDSLASREISSRLAACVNKVLNQRGWFAMIGEDRREDIVQECLERLIRCVRRGFTGVNMQFRTYLYDVVYSVTVLAVHKGSKEVSLDAEIGAADGSTRTVRELVEADLESSLGPVPNSKDPVEGLARAERSKRLAEVLATMFPEDRKLLCAFEVEKRPIKEIALSFGLTESNVSVRLHRLRDQAYRGYIRSYARTPSEVNEEWIVRLIGRLPEETGAVIHLWWKAKASVREIAKRLGLPEERCRVLLVRGKVDLSRLAEEGAGAP
jgi:RNA polymerase sigma factor (sigma-70 family)